jgi:hypothetical protein
MLRVSRSFEVSSRHVVFVNCDIWELSGAVRLNNAFEPSVNRYCKHAAGGIRESAPAARSDCRFTAAQRER